jgi:hypothetical protein
MGVEPFLNISQKKTESFYLTVEQVRHATCAWLGAQALPYSARKIIYQNAADTIMYRQKRSREARKSHWKTKLLKLRKLGIEISQLNSCIPREVQLCCAVVVINAFIMIPFQRTINLNFRFSFLSTSFQFLPKFYLWFPGRPLQQIQP